MKYIAMDCGGTKLQTVIHRPEVPVETMESIGVGHGSGNLTARLITAICAALPRSDETFDVVAICLAAIPVAIVERDRIVSAIIKSVKTKKVILSTDTLAAYFACSMGEDLVIAIGTGTTALFEVDSQLVEISGLGYLYGDEASAFWLGKEGINSALKFHDGRGEKTQLLEAALKHFNTSAFDLTNLVHQLDRPVPAISEFAQNVIGLAESGDAVAQEIVESACEEIWKIASAAQSRTAITSVKLIGGLIAHSDFYFQAISNLLKFKDPKLKVERPFATPIFGVEALVTSPVIPNLSRDIYIYDEAELSRLEAPNLSSSYLDEVSELLQLAKEANINSLKILIDFASNSLKNGGLIHTFGTGHSHLLAEEIFYRAGGLASVYPILDERLMLHKNVIQGSQNERLPGLYKELLSSHPIKSGDTVIIISNSGGNQVSIDLAIAAREIGAHVCALTSLNTAGSSSARAGAGKKLHDYADVVLDNCGIAGDALIEIPGVEFKVGPTSTVVGAALLQAMVVGVVQKLQSQEIDAEVFLSSNMQGGDQRNQGLFAKYFEIIPLYR